MDLTSIWPAIQDKPIIPSPPGHVPNLANPASRASEIYLAACVCLPLIVMFATMRLYAKVVILRKWTWDDVTCTLGVLAGLSYLSLTLAAATGGVYGRHMWEITYREFSANQLLLAEVFEAVYGPFIWLVKLSLFVLYLQIFRPLRWLRYLAYAGAVTTGLFYFAVMVGYIVLCAPKDYHGELALLTALHSPKCNESQRLVIVLGVVSLVSDLYLVILPLPAVWKLQLPLRRKIAVSAMFFTGSAACIASAFALAYRIELTQSQDATWLFVPLGVVTNVEFTAGILVCCMPTTMAVLKQLKLPVSSLLSTCRKALRSTSDYIATERYQLSSVTNLHPSQGDESYRSNGEDTKGAQRSRKDPDSPRSEWNLEHGVVLPVAREDRIRKTTDIKVIRHTHQ